MNTAQLIGQEAMVLEVLQEVEAARSDDYILFVEILERFYPELVAMPFREVMSNHHQLGVPSYESITRVRRKVQKKYPEYDCERARRKRALQEREYKAYARL